MQYVKNRCYRDYSDGFYVYCPPSSDKTTLDGVVPSSVMQAGPSLLKAGLKTRIMILTLRKKFVIGLLRAKFYVFPLIVFAVTL